MTVAIVADSGSDLAPWQLLESGIRQVPLSVSFGEQTYLSPDEMTPEAFWEKLRAADSPFAHTAAPSVGLFRQAFEKAFAEGHEAVVCVCLSEDLSATVKHARMASEMLPDRPIFVVDPVVARTNQGKATVVMFVPVRETKRAATTAATAIRVLRKTLFMARDHIAAGARRHPARRNLVGSPCPSCF